MKSALLSWLVLAFASQLVARTFTDTQGRKLEAEVVAVQQGQVRIRRADGKEFTLPVTTFVPADQAYLQQWKPAAAAANAPVAKPDPAAAKDAKADDRKISRALEDCVFPNWRNGVACGWKGRPALKISSADPELAKHVEAVVEEICTAAGLQPGGAAGELVVNLGNAEDLRALRKAETSSAIERGGVACFLTADDNQALTRAAIYQNTDTYDQDHQLHRKSELTTFLLKCFGLVDYTRDLEPAESSLAFSMSSEPGSLTLTALDKKLVSFVYKHLPPGTKKADLRGIFRKNWQP